jgi:hypothetical protein
MIEQLHGYVIEALGAASAWIVVLSLVTRLSAAVSRLRDDGGSLSGSSLL